MSVDGTGEVMLELSRFHIDSVGDPVLALMDDLPGGHYSLVELATKFGLGADGRLLADENSVEAGIAGRPVAERLAGLR